MMETTQEGAGVNRLIIVGSPRVDGRSAALAEQLFEACIEECPKDEVALAPVATLAIEGCRGCDACRQEADADMGAAPVRMRARSAAKTAPPPAGGRQLRELVGGRPPRARADGRPPPVQAMAAPARARTLLACAAACWTTTCRSCTR